MEESEGSDQRAGLEGVFEEEVLEVSQEGPAEAFAAE